MTDKELRAAIIKQRQLVSKAKTAYTKEVYTEQLHRYEHELKRRTAVAKAVKKMVR